MHNDRGIHCSKQGNLPSPGTMICKIACRSESLIRASHWALTSLSLFQPTTKTFALFGSCLQGFLLRQFWRTSVFPSSRGVCFSSQECPQLQPFRRWFTGKSAAEPPHAHLSILLLVRFSQLRNDVFNALLKYRNVPVFWTRVQEGTH